MTSSFTNYIEKAYKMALTARDSADVPVGAIIVKNNEIIASACNEVVAQSDPTAHAEILALRKASKALNSEFLTGCTLYVTLEPCPMCAYAISLARIERLVFGAYDVKRGAISTGSNIFNDRNHHHHCEIIGGIMEEECGELLKKFFKGLRDK